jgi:hypothetical protein
MPQLNGLILLFEWNVLICNSTKSMNMRWKDTEIKNMHVLNKTIVICEEDFKVLNKVTVRLSHCRPGT